MWDAGVKLGHAVRSLDEQLALTADDLDTATSLLSARTLAGDDELGARLATEGLAGTAATAAAGWMRCARG